MNKRITSLLLCFVMVFAMLATAVPVLAAESSCVYTFEADKTTAHRGDTITFTVYMQQKGGMYGLEGKISIPSGLTYVANSGKVTDGVKETLEWDAVDWTEESMILNGYGGGSDPYSSTDKLELMTFQCTVNSDAEFKSYSVGFAEDSYLAADELGDPKEVSCTPATITVSAAPVAVTGVTIDKTLSINIGQTKTPSFTVAPAEATNKTVSFTSDNTAVATVNTTTGAVTGVSKGTATITVKTADGNFTDTCTVTVSCAHTNKSTVAEQNSTCTVKGWDEYKKCDDCGQLFNTSDVEIDEVPFRNLADHTGGTATCTEKAVCSVCHQPYGNYADHSYTANTKKPEALKTAGTCKDKAIYLRSCEVCGKVAPSEAWGSFFGDLDPNNHVGGTSTVNASEPDHKNQIDGYTGDTKCLGCNKIIEYGTSIPAGAHTPSSTWNSNETHHWKECTTMGCGVVIDGSKAEHSSTGANVATCQHKAVCDVCNVEYGALAAHNPASGWTSDASGHWHACQTATCTEKCNFSSHTPDREAATETDPIKCSECDYEIAPALGVQNYTIDLPFSLAVKLTGDKKPAKETFKFEIYDLGCEDAEFEILNDVLTVENLEFDENGVVFVDGIIKIKVTGEDQLCNLTEGFSVRMVKGSTKGWTYASEQWHIEPFFENDALDIVIAVKEIVDGEISEEYANGMSFAVSYEAVTEPTDPTESSEPTDPQPEEPADPTESSEPTKPATPETGANSNMFLWIALLFVSGCGVFGATIYGKKKKENAE